MLFEKADEIILDGIRVHRKTALHRPGKKRLILPWHLAGRHNILIPGGYVLHCFSRSEASSVKMFVLLITEKCRSLKNKYRIDLGKRKGKRRRQLRKCSKTKKIFPAL